MVQEWTPQNNSAGLRGKEKLDIHNLKYVRQFQGGTDFIIKSCSSLFLNEIFRYFPDYPPYIKNGDGDGTVNRKSAEVCLRWNEKNNAGHKV